MIDTFDGAKPRFLNRGKKRRSVLTLRILRASARGVEWVDSKASGWEIFAKKVGIESKLASVRAVNVPVLDLAKHFEDTKKKMIEEAKKAKEIDRADVIVLGCKSMAFMNISDEMQEKLGIPVVNPAIVSLKVLESLIESNLIHSKTAYPLPPKL